VAGRRAIDLHESIPVIPDFFQLVHVRNTGAAFGIGANASSKIVPLLLNIGAIGVFCVVVVYAFRSAITDRLLQTGLHLILGGAIGNLVDRFRFGYVVDFLDVYVRQRTTGRRSTSPTPRSASASRCCSST
jgi:signal peptidase II